MTLKLKDPCHRAFFLRNEDLLEPCFHIHLWHPTDKIDMTPSEIFPWDITAGEDWQASPQFASGLLAHIWRGFRTIHVTFFGVN